jgi:hypothetical protein
MVKLVEGKFDFKGLDMSRSLDLTTDYLISWYKKDE